MSQFFRWITTVLFFALCADLGTFAADERPDSKEVKRFLQIAAVVQKNYVKQMSDNQLIEGAIQGMLKATKAPDTLVSQIESAADDATTKTRDVPQKTEGSSSPKQADQTVLNKFRTAIRIIQKQQQISEKELVDAAVKGMLASLNPYCSYLPPEDYSELKTETKGQFGGAGIELAVREGILTVVAPIEGGPAHRVQLKPGDKIAKINGQSTENLELPKAVKLLRGRVGSKVTLTIVRDGGDPKDLTMTREFIQHRPVKHAVLEPGFAYIRIANFPEGTDTAVKEAIQKLGGEEMIKGLVLDLRNNPGGLLDQSVKVANLFISKGLIGYTDGRVRDQRMEFRASSTVKQYGFRVAVLINSGSAGGAEFTAGALQDNDRSVIFGTKSFAMGSIQTIVPLDSSSGLRLTTAYYYAPKGRSIQRTGIVPDVALEGPCLPCEQASTDKVALGNDGVIQKALEWLKSDTGVKEYKAKMRKPLPDVGFLR